MREHRDPARRVDRVDAALDRHAVARHERAPAGAERWYSIHNPYLDPLDPHRAFVAWYSDGVRLLDISNPRAPAELDSWVPPHDAFVWSVAFLNDLVLVGDVHTGLYVLHR